MKKTKLLLRFIQVFILSFFNNKAKHKLSQIALILFDKPTHISHNDHKGTTNSFLVKGDALIEDLSKGLRP